MLIPSYLCARTSAPEWAARRVAEEILCRELCDFYVSNGDLILFPACTQLHSSQEGERVCCPSAVWLDTLAGTISMACTVINFQQQPTRFSESRSNPRFNI